MTTQPLAVALDVPTLDEAVGLAAALADDVAMAKVGLELFSAHGPAAVAAVADHLPVFLDVKLHDIPTTVERACQVLGGLGVAMLTVHTAGSHAMVAAAVEGLARGHADAGRAGAPPKVLGVTVLTSLDRDDLRAVAMPDASEQVPRLALVALDAGAQGIVCAPQHVGDVRRAVGVGMTVVTPGVRPAGAGDDDHARPTTPAQAIRDGADLLVVGRPITRADDPVAAARAIADEVREAADERADANASEPGDGRAALDGG